MREEDSVRPGWDSFLRTCVILLSALIKLVSWIEKELTFLVRLENIAFHTTLVQFIFCHQCLVILLLDQVRCLCLRHVDSEIQIAEQYFHAMVLDLVSMILSASLTFIDHLRDLVQLIVSFVDITRVHTAAEMAIEENKGAVFKAESHSDSTFVSFRICNIRLDRSHGNIEDASLDF